MKSVYIHIPFCNNICNYCDFCKFYYNKEWVNKYLDALEKEILSTYKKEDIYTIYIGGGTPSILSPIELNKLFKIIKNFNTKKLEEFTIECNLEDITEEKLDIFKKNSVNRISIGVQSFNKKILFELGRNNKVNIKEKINLVKKYFDNISIDLIYAYFNETKENLKKDLKEFINLDIKHISCYSLMIEENTKFYNKKPISEDLDYEMYKIVNKTLKDSGFSQYEISNYSKKNYESKHNLVYWNNLEYYGFGLNSSSYLNKERVTNTRNFFSYINGINKKKIEKLRKKDIIKYELILGFRKIKGINKKDFYNKYNIDIKKVFNIKDLLKKCYLKENKNYVFIPQKYLYISNEILINFV